MRPPSSLFPSPALCRPTQPSHFWPDQDHILAGRDLVGGGTWLAVGNNGRIAFLTNLRAEDVDPDEVGGADKERQGAELAMSETTGKLTFVGVCTSCQQSCPSTAPIPLRSAGCLCRQQLRGPTTTHEGSCRLTSSTLGWPLASISSHWRATGRWAGLPCTAAACRA
jgi:hypothetical protein